MTAYVRPDAKAASFESGRITISTVSPDLTTQGETSNVPGPGASAIVDEPFYRYGS